MPRDLTIPRSLPRMPGRHLLQAPPHQLRKGPFLCRRHPPGPPKQLIRDLHLRLDRLSDGNMLSWQITFNPGDFPRGGQLRDRPSLTSPVPYQS